MTEQDVEDMSVLVGRQLDEAIPGQCPLQSAERDGRPIRQAGN
jgi:hypothetical protein